MCLAVVDKRVQQGRKDFILKSVNYRNEGSPGGSVVKNLPGNAGDLSLIRKIPWRRKWQPTPVFLPGKSHGQRSLAGYSPQGLKRVGHDLATNNNNKWCL